ncbi:hypothetical protein Tco_1011914 [Tanacetum coccineum]
MTQQSLAEFPQLESSLVVPMFQQEEDPIECTSKAMAFLSAVASRFPPSNNQLRTSSNPRNQATIQDGRVTVQQVQGRQTQSYAGIGNTGIATTSKRAYGETVYSAKRPRNAAWFKEKLMLAEAQEAGQILDEDQLAFLADPGISEAPVTQQTIPHNSTFQSDDLDAYNSDCDDLSSTKAVLMANLSSCDPEVLSEVPYSDSYPNDMINQDVQEMQYSEQTHVDDFEDNEIHSGSNIILYSQYLQESQDAVIQDTNPSAPNDLLVLSLVEKMTDHVAHLDKENQTNKMDGSVIAKEHAVIFVLDDEETLILEEESRSKMLDKQNDSISIEKKIKISPIDYSKLNKIKEDFENYFVTKKELSAEQAFWLKHSSLSETPITLHTPVRTEAPSEHPKVSLVHEIIKKLKYQLANFDKVVKKRLTSDAITAGSWGFVHTKECFVTEIILFLKVLKDTFNAFDKTILDEITEVQTVFNQMEAAIDKCSVDKNVFEIQIKQLRIDNDQLLNQIMSQEIVHIVANSVDIFDVKKSCVNHCNKCLGLETELFKKKYFIEKETYDKLVKSYSNLEKHCISLELATQLNQEIFQRENSAENLNAPTFNQLFEINELKAQSQEKDTVIRKLKERIKSLSGKDSVENVKKDIDEIETINIELEHSVAKLLLENENLRKEREHLKSIYKDQFDSIRKTQVQSKEHCDSLIAQINAKSVEHTDLNAQLQEKVFAITTLKNELRKLKGENVVNTAVSKPNATIAPGMFKLDIEPRTIWMLMSEKLVAVTPINKDKRVRFAEPVTSSNNIPNQTDSLQTKDYNKPLLTFTGVKATTSASGSKPLGNTKNYRVSRPPRSNPKNNIEDHSREVKSSLNKMNFVSKPISNALVMYSMRNANFESICAICNKCLFDANHDMCLIDFVNDVNVVHIVLWYLDCGCSKHMTGNRSQLMNFVCKFLGAVRFGNDQVAKIMGYGDYQLGNITISRVYYLAKEGLARGIPKLKFQKHNLCSACALGKGKKSSHQPKAEDNNQEKQYLLHMDLCGPIRIESINGKKYILVIVDDYS